MLSILTDSLHKIAYSTDASIYREVPRGVAYPESTQDIVELLNEARRLNTCLIPRAAGTSVAGQVVGKGIVVDIKGVTRSNYGAPLLLVVGCRPANAWVRRYDGKNGAEVDAAIVATYLMLAAESEGLATLWVGSFDPALLRDILPGTEGYELVAMINVGYPAPGCEPSPMHSARKSVEELVTRVE